MTESLIEQPKKIAVDEDTGKFDVAIIDDDPSFSLMLKDYLFSSGELKSQIFRNGGDFLKDYRSMDPRKIILDYNLGEGPNGIAILQQIKQINPTAFVILVSAQDDLETAIETMRKGAADYFIKTNKSVFANILSSLMKRYDMEKNMLN